MSTDEKVAKLEADVKKLQKTTKTLFRNQNWLRKEIAFSEEISWPEFLAQALLKEFNELEISKDALAEFIDQTFQERKYELTDEIGRLTIQARRGDDEAAKKLIKYLAQVPPEER